MTSSNNTINKLTNLELSIQISLNGLSFCILERNTNTITNLKQISFEKKLNPLELLDQLKGIFNSEHALQTNFSKVHVIHDNDLSTLVPKSLFNDVALADYLKFNSKILKSDFITYDHIALNDSICVYVPYININNYLYDKYGEFTFMHISCILIESILQLEKNSESTKFYVNVSLNHIELIIVDKSKLLFYNTFEYVTKEDFIYYILFTAEQLNLNPEVFNLVFIGDINKDDEFYKITYRYVRHVEFGNRNDVFKYSELPKSKYSNFALIKSF
ncbi:DUF3822 family protein [Seonamhaeicola sediminis]|uniref:DUF3822 family protein n=1 Tax=Seonamhaeicola sediminis TaxID=2528206 RepID=A0A562YFP9_9FLAO|nr:DUF3822 family protein [Seonamhaeicola sediminis]